MMGSILVGALEGGFEQSGEDRRQKAGRPIRYIVVFLIALLLLAAMALALSTVEAHAKGASATGAKWSKRVVDATVGGKSTFSVRVKDSNLVNYVYVTMESKANKGMYRYFSLDLESGTNRNGKWTAEVEWYSYHKGTWRVTELTTRTYNGSDDYNFRLKKPKGIGGKIVVKVAPESKTTVSVPSQKQAGKTVVLSAVVKKGKKRVRSGKVAFSVSWYYPDSGWTYRTVKAKLSKKGVAKKSFKMPSCGYDYSDRMAISVSASYLGKKGVAQPSYSKSSKCVYRSFPTAWAMSFALDKTSTSSSEETVYGTVVSNRPLKGGRIFLDYRYVRYDGTLQSATDTFTVYKNDITKSVYVDSYNDSINRTTVPVKAIYQEQNASGTWVDKYVIGTVNLSIAP
jgi:hypothetical protein